MTTDPVRVEDTAENMAWGDNFLEINGVWYSKRETNQPTNFINCLRGRSRKQTALGAGFGAG